MKQNKKYEAPTLSVEEVRIEKAFLAGAMASANLPQGATEGKGFEWDVVRDGGSDTF